MLISDELPFIRDYVSAINAELKRANPEKALSRLQGYWLSFVILGLLVTNSLCWQRFERFGIGKKSTAGLSWMFRKAVIAEMLLHASVLLIVSTYKIKSCVLIIDDTDKERSKSTTEIAKVHKIKDKKTGGYFKGQNIVFLVLVSEELTIPVGFHFYEPDPKMSAWRKEELRLRSEGVQKQDRPKPPEADANYPDKKTLALKLISNFVDLLPEICVRAVDADAFYCSKDFIAEATRITGQKQMISQIKKTQLINVGGKNIAVEKFFENATDTKTEELILRGSKKKVTYCSGRFKVKSHDRKYFIIALKYGDEKEYRYLIASDSSWRDVDIIKTYALRWLVEVFIQDWKSYEGWNQLAKQQGVDGSDRGVILSLLSDHALLLHQDQKVMFENKQPAATVASLRAKVIIESLQAFIAEIVLNKDPKGMFEKYLDKISQLFELRSSIKHLRRADMSFCSYNQET